MKAGVGDAEGLSKSHDADADIVHTEKFGIAFAAEALVSVVNGA